MIQISQTATHFATRKRATNVLNVQWIRHICSKSGGGVGSPRLHHLTVDIQRVMTTKMRLSHFLPKRVSPT